MFQTVSPERVVVVVVVEVIMKLAKHYETNLSNIPPRKKSKPRSIVDMERWFIHPLFSFKCICALRDDNQ